MKRKFPNATRILALFFLFLASMLALRCRKAEIPGNFILIGPDDSLEDVVRKASQVVPSPQQLAWQEMEFTGFLHFTVNTFTDREWGTGKEDKVSLFCMEER